MSSSNPTTGLYPEKVRFVWQTPAPHAHRSTAHNGQDVGSTYKHRNKENVGYNSILCSLENELKDVMLHVIHMPAALGHPAGVSHKLYLAI